MQFGRIIISFFLIFSYSFGFAHSLVPHCSDSSPVEINHQHKHQSELNNSHEKHEHIVHANHFDEGIYDLLICLMSDSHNGTSDCCTQHVSSNTSSLSAVLSNNDIAKLVSSFVAIFGIAENNEKTHFSELSDVIYTSPEVNAHSLRGPPSIS
tara:strand:+ start:3443 stop:3901 length:459 start_codon:yes stop_codon:yes gene_type:complete